MWFYGWEPLMVSHHQARCDDHRHCSGGDVLSCWRGRLQMLLLRFPITVYLLRTWLDSTRHIFNNWSHTLKTATGQKVEKKIGPSVQKWQQDGKQNQNANWKVFLCYKQMSWVLITLSLDYHCLGKILTNLFLHLLLHLLEINSGLSLKKTPHVRLLHTKTMF